ncbi:MAG: DUF6263 family protein [bacterium]
MKLAFNYKIGKILQYEAKSVVIRQVSKVMELLDAGKFISFSNIYLKPIAYDDEGYHIKIKVFNKEVNENELSQEITDDIKTTIVPVSNQIVYMLVSSRGEILESAGSNEVSTLVFPDYDINIGDSWVNPIKFSLPTVNQEASVNMVYTLKNIKDNIAIIEAKSNEVNINLPINMEIVSGKSETFEGNFIINLKSYTEFDLNLGTNVLQEINIDTIIKVQEYVMENNVYNTIKLIS